MHSPRSPNSDATNGYACTPSMKKKAAARFFSSRWSLTFLSCLSFSECVSAYTSPLSLFRSSHPSRRVVHADSKEGPSRLDFGRPRWHNHYHRNIEFTCRHLFFRRTETTSAPRRRTLKSETLERMKSRELSLPFLVEFEEESNEVFPADDRMYVRLMKVEDIEKVMPMCIEEFGQGPSMSLFDFPLYDVRKVSNWWDRVYFEPSVYLSLRSKINANLNPGPKAKDPSVMVLCRSSDPSNTGEEDVIGMVEVSLQAPEADKNPPPFPFPLWFKVIYCRLKGSRLQGWVTNLLIDPRYRGLGYSKILMAATEGIARSWDCNYIYLHADADYRSGKTAQKLYKRLGYEVVTDSGPEYAWMMGDATENNPFSSIRMIEGVPLLCFCKRLEL